MDGEALLTAVEIEQGNGELSFPVDLEIPADQPPTGEAESRWETNWTLTMKIEPGTGYGPAFDITVNRDDGVGSGPTDPRGASAPVLLKSARAISTDPEATREKTPPPRPPHARVSVTSLPEGGTEFTPPRKIESVVFALWCLITLPLWVVLPIWGLADLKGVESPPLIAYLVQLGVAFGGIPVAMVTTEAEARWLVAELGFALSNN